MFLSTTLTINAYDKTFGLDKTVEGTGIQKTELTKVIGSLIKTVLTFIGAILFLLILAGGFMWMTSAGEEDKVKKAKQIITNAVIGVIIVVLAYTITYFVMKTVTTMPPQG